MGLPDFFNWRSQSAAQTTASMPAVADEDLAADVDEPPDHGLEHEPNTFYKSTIHPAQLERKVSLLTKALKTPDVESYKPEIHVATDLSRRRSMMSNMSLASASTAELTSDGGLTSPARTDTPSPPFPTTTYTSFAPYSLAPKSTNPIAIPALDLDIKDPISQIPEATGVSPKTQPEVVAPKKRCITFACGRRSSVSKPASMVSQVAATTIPTAEAPKRKCAIKFACGNPKPSDEPSKENKMLQPPKTPESFRRNHSRSPSVTRKSPRLAPPSTSRSHRDSTSTVRHASHSPSAVRAKPKYIVIDEKTMLSSEATRFHEFASGEIEEDDWIRKETDNPRERLTISDTLKKENAIRQLGNEAEEEALEEDENDDEEEDEDDQYGSGDDEDEDEEDDEDDDEEASDGNETDNEAGFAESDDETDGEGDFAFWTPGRNIHLRQIREVTPYRASAHRTASTSSLESVGRSQPRDEIRIPRRQPRPIKNRPVTPDLPDSTDFVCGTLDEDRPLEDAYVSCMEARKLAKHKRCPQDIDPSFPTSDPEDEEDEHDILEPNDDSGEHVWLHGKFEDSDDEHRHRRRTLTGHRRSPGQSPRRLHSPPPPRRLHSPPPNKARLRSPPPRKLFGHSPKRLRSPPPARTIRSPQASPTNHARSAAIAFAPLGSRPGLTHTKSLPRATNAFCRQYRANRLAAANGINVDDGNDGHVRGAMDIVKGLEQKRQRRKEKFYQKNFNRKNKVDRKPQPGKGAERMEQLGLLLSGKTGVRDPYMMSA